MTCHNCGLPEGALFSKGKEMSVVLPAENAFKRERKSTVWVCSQECEVQAAGISKYGRATHKWPVTLDQFRTMYRRQHAA